MFSRADAKWKIVKNHDTDTDFNIFRVMSHVEIVSLLNDLRSGKYRSDQIEKNTIKWFNKLFKSLNEETASSSVILAFLKELFGEFRRIYTYSLDIKI